MLKLSSGLSLFVLVTACGGGSNTPPPAAKPAEPEPSRAMAGPASPPAEKAEPAAESGPTIPAECASQGEVCTPPRAFVKKLCADVYPNVALVMFRKGTPWTRAYLTRKTEAWNASGGASVSGYLEFDEEVIVLQHREAAKGGMQVSGAGGGYEALRWTGACVTLAGEEVTLRHPPQAKYPRIEWKWIEPDMREALKEGESVQKAFIEYKNECKGVTSGEVSKKCVTADGMLSRRIVEYVSEGGTLAMPTKLPE